MSNWKIRYKIRNSLEIPIGKRKGDRKEGKAEDLGVQAKGYTVPK
jgi:hypothetical protein